MTGVIGAAVIGGPLVMLVALVVSIATGKRHRAILVLAGLGLVTGTAGLLLLWAASSDPHGAILVALTTVTAGDNAALSGVRP